MVRAEPKAAVLFSAGTFKTLLIGAALALLVLAVYGQMARGLFSFYPGEPFQFIDLDDGDYVTANPWVKQGLTWDSVRWAFVAYHSANWHPLTWLSLMLDVELFDFRPAGYHFVNVCWHLANVLLLFVVLRRMTGQIWPHAIVAALFAVHPLHVESVAWVTERKDVLSTFFALLAMLAYDAYARRPGWVRYGLILAAYSLSLLSKQMWVTLPFALVLLDYWPLRRLRRLRFGDAQSEVETRYASRSRWQLVLEKIPLFMLAAVFSGIVFWIQRDWGAMSDLERISLGQRLQNALISYLTYLTKTFWPSDLGVLYPHPMKPYPLGQILWTSAVLVAITLVAVWNWRKRPWLIVGWLWYLGTLVPVIGIIQVGAQAWADRYAYVPHIGLFVMLVWGAAGVISDLGKWGLELPARLAGVAVTVVALLGFTYAAHQQVRLWQNTELLFTHTLKVTPDNYMICTHLAAHWTSKDRIDEARKLFRRALEINPRGVEALTQLGYCIATHVEDKSEARRVLKRALELEPDAPAPKVYLALLLTDEGKTDEAIAMLNSVIAARRVRLLAYAGLGAAYARRGDSQKTIEAFKTGLEIDPYDATLNNALADYYVSIGKIPEALPYYELVLRISPDDALTHLDYGTALAKLGRLRDAKGHFEVAVQRRPLYAEARMKLGMALAAEGKTQQALAELEKAIEFKADWAPPLNDAAWILATDPSPGIRNAARAVDHAEKACRITKHEDPSMLDTLAAAYAEAGRWNEAVATAEKAMALANKIPDKAMADSIATRAALYRSKQPYRAQAAAPLGEPAPAAPVEPRPPV